MKLSRPTKTVFWISVILAGLGILGSLVSIPVVSSYTFLLVVLGYILLFLGNVLKGF